MRTARLSSLEANVTSYILRLLSSPGRSPVINAISKINRVRNHRGISIDNELISYNFYTYSPESTLCLLRTEHSASKAIIFIVNGAQDARFLVTKHRSIEKVQLKTLY